MRIYSDGQFHKTNSVFSGFLWRHAEQILLVTNWHNVTGLHQQTLCPSGTFFPSHINVGFWTIIDSSDGRDKLAHRSATLPLYAVDHQPLWTEDLSRHAIDVVTIPFDHAVPKNRQVVCLNDCNFEDRWQAEIGDDCFIVGYPEGLVGPSNTPIWKRGSVATEPQLNYHNQPMMLIDTLGNHGLSGSPVIGQGSGVFTADGGDGWTSESKIGTWRGFIGIYSGRTAANGVGFQLGRVWKPEVLH